jgi:FkbM family methyltransferase
MAELAYLESAPLWFTTLKNLSRRRLRGTTRVTRLLERFGCFGNKAVRVPIERGLSIYVPIYRPEHWDRRDLLEYERDLMDTLVQVASAGNAPLTIIDCGADIGLTSLILATRIRRVSEIVAFEPSGEAFPVLQKNLNALPFRCEALQCAVSDFSGQGKLISPEYDASHHARYLAPASSDGFPVTTVDSLSYSAGDLLIKIDVEGGEIGVVRGARRTIASANSAIITVEAHPRVFARTGVDPIRVLGELAAIRPFEYILSEARQVKLNLSRPFFEQVSDTDQIYNVVATSVAQ